MKSLLTLTSNQADFLMVFATNECKSSEHVLSLIIEFPNIDMQAPILSTSLIVVAKIMLVERTDSVNVYLLINGNDVKGHLHRITLNGSGNPIRADETRDRPSVTPSLFTHHYE